MKKYRRYLISIEIHPKAQEVHGMSYSKLSKSPDVQTVLPSFMAWVGSSPLIAHNAKYSPIFRF